MQRYFVAEKQWDDQTLTIGGDDYHHIANVMRMKPDDHVICNHPDGVAYLCLINKIDEQMIHLTRLEALDNQVELPINLTLIHGLPKGDKLEWVVQKATELGVHSIIPLNSARSIVKWDLKKQQKKVERLQKIAKEASEQSHRTVQPIVHLPHTMKQLLSSDQIFDHKFVAYEETARTVKAEKLHTHLEQIKPGQSVVIAIGPEGGFTETEIEQFYEADFQPIRLGPRILRTETAPLYFLSALSYLLEEMD